MLRVSHRYHSRFSAWARCTLLQQQQQQQRAPPQPSLSSMLQQQPSRRNTSCIVLPVTQPSAQYSNAAPFIPRLLSPGLTLSYACTRSSTASIPLVSPFFLPAVAASYSTAPSVTGVISFPLAQTGEGISECELIQWFVKEGDSVAEFDKVCEVQSDKASIEITSRYQGTILRLHHGKGDIVKVGAPLLDIQLPTTTDTALGSTTSVTPTEEAAAAAAAAAAAVVAVGVEGRVQAALPRTGAGAGEGAGLLAASQQVLSSPATRQLAREYGVPIAAVPGSGRDGRVTKDDVERYVELHRVKASSGVGLSQEGGPLGIGSVGVTSSGVGCSGAGPLGGQEALGAVGALKKGSARETTGGMAGEAAAAGGVSGTSKVLPLRGFRRAMVKSMTAVAMIPHFHYTDEVSVDALKAVRAVLAGDPSLAGVKLTLLPLIIKALSSALVIHPEVNSSLGPSGSELLLHGDHNIGLAMAAPGGLVVPNIKQVQKLSVSEVAAALHRLQAQAQANQLTPTDVTGGTISISNIGTIGGIHAAPLVNPPEVAIVALGRVQVLPQYNEAGQLVPRSLLPISWGADHRVVDGAGLARLSNSWKQLLEEPSRLLLHLR